MLLYTVIYSQENNDDAKVVGDSLIGKVLDGQNVREVVGNVRITQGNVEITCDTAVQYLRDNRIKLIGDVEVLQDTIKILTEVGYYFGNEKIAYSDTGVIMYDGHMILAAMQGYYYFDEKKAFFYKKVKLVDAYNTLTANELTYFHQENKSVAVGSVKMADSTSSIYADSLIHFKDTKESYAYQNIKITNNENNLIIFGNVLEDFSERNYTKITGKPMLVQIDTSVTGIIDTLLVSAEIMESILDSTKKLIATDSVKIIRGSFYSVSNSAVFFRDEDRIFTHKNAEEKTPPILWFENSQLIGDSINIYLKDNQLEMIDVNNNAFILSRNKDYSFRFDQIEGNEIKIFFGVTGIKRTEVDGNVLSIYYMYENGKPNGLIKSSSEKTNIIFENKQVVDVRLYGSPASEYHPEVLVTGNEKDFTLPSFILYNNKPDRKQFLKKLKRFIQ